MNVLDGSTPKICPFGDTHVSLVGGTGAVGSYFVSRLVEAGMKVTVIGSGKSHHFNQIKQHGLRILTSEGTKEIPAPLFTDTYPSHKQNLVIIALKQPAFTAEVAKNIALLADSKTIIGVITNGLPFFFLDGLNNRGKHCLESVDPNGEIHQALKDTCIIGIAPFIAATIKSEGVTEITRPLKDIVVKIGAAVGTPNVEKIERLFNAAHIPTSVANIRREILMKEQFAITINTLSALTNQTIDEVASNSRYKSFMRYGVEFINQLSLQLGIGQLRTFEEFVKLSLTKGHHSSLCNDINQNKTPEIAAIVDSIIELATFMEIPHLEPLIELRRLLEIKVKAPQSMVSLESLFRLVEQLT